MTRSAARTDHPLTVHAAGSLKAAFGEIARRFEAAPDGVPVRLVFGAAGQLQQRLLAGEPADVFASANLEHPAALVALGRAEAVRPFACNALCALAAPGFALGTATLLERLLDPAVKLGTSTPKADPSGDYAFALFDRAEAAGLVPAGGAARLKAKALQLTGGWNSVKPASGRNTYGALVASGQADVFLTYRTNATLALREEPRLQVLALPAAIDEPVRYGLVVLNDAVAPRREHEAARRFAAHLFERQSQNLLQSLGFLPP